MGRKPVKKLRKNRPEIRNKWVEQLMPLYFGGKLSKATMQEVAAILEISKATLYKHFSSRLEIIEAAVELKINEVFEFDTILSDEKLDFLKRFNEAVKVASYRLAGISNAFLLDLKQLYPELWQKIINFIDLAIERIKLFYLEGINKGILNNLDPNILALTDKIFISALSDPQFLIDNNLSLHSAIESYFNMKSFGIFKSKSK